MNRRKLKILVCILILILWISTIFVLSSLNGFESNRKSYNAINFTIRNGLRVTNKLSITNVNSRIKAIELSNRLNYPLRKVAHATEYCILGIIVVSLLRGIKVKNKYFLSLLSCFLYACTDEMHQIFTGRTPMFKDVLIDTAGCMIGLLIFYIISSRKRVAYREKV